MSRRARGAVSVVTALAVLLVAGPGSPRLLLAAEGGTAATVKYSQYLQIRPGELRGQVLYPDGKTPAAKVPVRVWSVEAKKFVYQSTTDEKGRYRLPKLAPGRYLVIFGDRMSVEVRVVEGAELSGQPLNVIIPRGQAFFAPEDMTVELMGEVEEGDRKLLRSLLILGGGTITAVGIAALAGAFKGGGGNGKKVIVSP